MLTRPANGTAFPALARWLLGYLAACLAARLATPCLAWPRHASHRFETLTSGIGALTSGIGALTLKC